MFGAFTLTSKSRSGTWNTGAAPFRIAVAVLMREAFVFINVNITDKTAFRVSPGDIGDGGGEGG
jgi:hypothetical protein